MSNAANLVRNFAFLYLLHIHGLEFLLRCRSVIQEIFRLL
jgi:hypothetical protein